jgi:hypothetical protein
MDRARRNVIYRAPRESPAELTGGVKEDPLTVSTGWSIGSAADDDRNPAIEKRQLWAAPRVAVSGDSEMFGSKEGDKLEMPPFPVPSVGELGEVRIPAHASVSQALQAFLWISPLCVYRKYVRGFTRMIVMQALNPMNMFRSWFSQATEES